MKKNKINLQVLLIALCFVALAVVQLIKGSLLAWLLCPGLLVMAVCVLLRKPKLFSIGAILAAAYYLLLAVIVLIFTVGFLAEMDVFWEIWEASDNYYAYWSLYYTDMEFLFYLSLILDMCCFVLMAGAYLLVALGGLLRKKAKLGKVLFLAGGLLIVATAVLLCSGVSSGGIYIAVYLSYWIVEGYYTMWVFLQNSLSSLPWGTLALGLFTAMSVMLASTVLHQSEELPAQVQRSEEIPVDDPAPEGRPEEVAE